MKKKLLWLWVIAFLIVFLVKVLLNSELFWPKQREVFQFHKIYDNAGDGTIKDDSSEHLDNNFSSDLIEYDKAELSVDQFIEVSGKRFIDDVQKQVKINKISLDYSFYKLKKAGKVDSGVVIVRFGIDWKGHVVFTKLQSTTVSNKTFCQKIEEDMYEWRFPVVDAKDDTTEVIYPLLFK